MKHLKTFEHIDQFDQDLDYYYKAIKACQYFAVTRTIKFNNDAFMFEAPLVHQMECGKDKKGVYFKNDPSSDKIYLKTLEQLLEYCAINIYNSTYRNAQNHTAIERRPIVLMLWKKIIENDSTYKNDCPFEILKDLPDTSLGNASKFGVFEHGRNIIKL